IWQELLGLERVGRNDHFFELGGHSLLVISMIERLRLRDIALDVRTIFTAPTLAALAAAAHHGEQHDAIAAPANLITANCTRITPAMLSLVTLEQEQIDRIANNVAGGAANIQDIYPLAPLQEGILFHHLLEAEGDAYLLRTVMTFDQRTLATAFLDALQTVIDRHDILRSAIHWDGLAQAVQVVWRTALLQIEELTPQVGTDVLEQLLAYADPRRLRLDLRRAPLLTVYLAQDPLTLQCHLVLLNHHMVADHVTRELIIDEIGLLLQNRADALPTPLPYRDFIAQARSVPQDEHEAYFRAQLADIDEPTAPFSIINVQGSGSQIREALLPLNTELAQRIRNAARRFGVTPAVLFHVAWAQVLAACSDRDDVVFGTLLSGRLQGSTGADRVLGMFINTLPIRISLTACSAEQALTDTYKGLSALLLHEQAPLALAQRCSGVKAPLPLFTTLLNYRHSASTDMSVLETHDAMAGMHIVGGEERTNYPITVAVDDYGNAFDITAQCVAGVEPQRIAAYLVTAIDALVIALESDAEQPLRSLPILPDHERHELLDSFNNTAVDFPRDLLIHQLFEQQAAAHPEATALVFE
ncbi:condensation domain-containing protein, partial [Undibacterium sp. 10I3]